VPAPLARLLRATANRLPRNERAKRAARLLGLDERRALLSIFEITDAALRSGLRRSSDDASDERDQLVGNVLSDVAGRDVLEQALYLDTHLFLPDGLLVYGDKMSMASGLEQRVPFLDLELMEFVERIPARLRVRRMENKWLYRKSLAGLLPTEILERRKRPFATPYDEWLRSSLGNEVARRFDESETLAEHIDPEVVGRLVREHAAGRDDHKRVLYCLLELAQWADCFLDTEGAEGHAGRRAASALG
jgi:asparagine synthase (glutamine-hydrolysing)